MSRKIYGNVWTEIGGLGVAVGHMVKIIWLRL